MADEILMAIATALAAKAADAAAGAAHEAWTRLVRLVRGRLGGGARGAAALETARARPDDREAVSELAGALERATADQEFAAELRALWLEAEPQVSATGASAVNVVTGTVGGHLVQARHARAESLAKELAAPSHPSTETEAWQSWLGGLAA